MRFQSNRQKNAGFTIVELIVSMALFIVVTLISIGALLSIVGVNKKTQSLKSVVNNINFAVESISKSMRVGSNYHCEDVVGEIVPPNLDTPRDCSAGGNFVAFESSGGNRDSSSDQVVFRLNGAQIERSVDGGASFVGMTAPEVVITENTGLRFYVLGAPTFDALQPKVIIVIRGEVDLGPKAKTNFDIQTSLSQRELGS
ncbi:hypothetical protein COV42_02555 [Candidatus Campbellbacteria bacterium CG11_big_fil_rev_8_21_14_0_20_44_21]|uniref:Prepilin-type N-terminal cleavage/methylation domain-containing protein n=1 Tax=Candidatus Campbellbacteria bacterium CG22_combo_CG10-13_8_21_14_all_43_18 TaxID=1974530 RepID=A0A2H0DYB4_9BACT|nr:MAG: hypothetical protein COW82_00630 [Candidatus Campbellbacteria bacterium CG22_combo_CG10-13_8_21_14_all_43_18]PIR24101.1 MAG: hypothetical protein COV42_02555 [Candidatus Campbellbacteria bacterium CG11_big_fil_rev_8_21_14_0_20_44_21]